MMNDDGAGDDNKISQKTSIIRKLYVGTEIKLPKLQAPPLLSSAL